MAYLGPITHAPPRRDFRKRIVSPQRRDFLLLPPLPSSAAAAAPPPASRQSPRALASVLRAPASDPVYAPPSPLAPLLPGLGSAGDQYVY